MELRAKVKNGGRILDIQVLDHIIITSQVCYRSLMEATIAFLVIFFIA